MLSKAEGNVGPRSPDLSTLASCTVKCRCGSFSLFPAGRARIKQRGSLHGAWSRTSWSLTGRSMSAWERPPRLLTAALGPGLRRGARHNQPHGLKDRKPPALGVRAARSLCPRPPGAAPIGWAPCRPRPAICPTHAREPAAATASAPAPGQRRRPRAWTRVAAAAAAVRLPVRLPARVRKGSSGPRGSPWPQTAAPRTGRADGSADPARRPCQHPRPRYPRSRHMSPSFIPQPLPELLPAPPRYRPPDHARILPGQFSLSLIPATVSPHHPHRPSTCPTHCSYLTS